MNVSFDKAGTPKVTFHKAEREALAKSAKLLEMLGRSTQCKEATDASVLVTTVIGKFIPVKAEAAK